MSHIHVKVRPNARESRLEPIPDGTWIARVRSAPVDGKANAELIELVAVHFQVRKSQVTIRSGAGGRLQLIRIEEDSG